MIKGDAYYKVTNPCSEILLAGPFNFVPMTFRVKLPRQGVLINDKIK